MGTQGRNTEDQEVPETRPCSRLQNWATNRQTPGSVLMQLGFYSSTITGEKQTESGSADGDHCHEKLKQARRGQGARQGGGRRQGTGQQGE